MFASLVLYFFFADVEISGNVCDGNEEGIRVSMGSSYNKILDNVVTETAGSESLFSIVVWVRTGGAGVLCLWKIYQLL